jgi:hypothetical protein
VFYTGSTGTGYDIVVIRRLAFLILLYYHTKQNKKRYCTVFLDSTPCPSLKHFVSPRMRWMKRGFCVFVLQAVSFMRTADAFNTYRQEYTLHTLKSTTRISLQETSKSASRVNPLVRSCMGILTEKYPGFAFNDWTKTRTYLYQQKKLTTTQVETVLAFLEELFPEDPGLQASIIQNIPRILRKNVKTKLRPTSDFLKELYGDVMFHTAIERKPNLLLSRGLGYELELGTLEVVEMFLSKQLNCSDAAISKLKRNAPHIFQAPLSTLLGGVAFFENILRQDNKYSDDHITKILAKIVSLHPKIIQLSPSTKLQPQLEFFKERCGFESADIAVLVQSSSASVWGLSVEANLKPTIDFLAAILPEKQDLRKCLLAHPQLLALSLANLKEKVDYFNSFSDRTEGKQGLAARVLLRTPAVYSLSLSNSIKPKIEFLGAVWGTNTPLLVQRKSDDYDTVGRKRLNSLLCTFPNVLTLSLEGNIRPTIKFYNRTGYIQLNKDWRPVTTKAGQTNHLLHGRFIATSLYNRLLPRWHICLEQAKSKEGAHGIDQLKLPLHILVSASDLAFCKYCGFSTDEYNTFCQNNMPELKYYFRLDKWINRGLPIDS